MAQAGTRHAEKDARVDKETRLAEMAQSVKSAGDFAKFMTATMAALISGDIEVGVANGVCALAKTMLHAIELQVRYGSPNREGRKELSLTEPPQLAEGEEQASKPDKRTYCVDCYADGDKFITATMDDDGDPLCLAHFNSRVKQDALLGKGSD